MGGIAFVGLDVDKATVTVAVAAGDGGLGFWKALEEDIHPVWTAFRS